ncbi:MAG: hypothetical protein JKY93_07440 [Gammaproteobacteria bacterium]|nr:hypothetical protein [Gammaproteobacteria bacterium]
MSFLDALKEEANSKENKASQSKEEQAKLAAEFAVLLKQQRRTLSVYFRELVETLTRLKPDYVKTYDLQYVGQTKKLLIGDFNIADDTTAGSEDTKFSFTYTGNVSLKIEVGNRKKVHLYKDYLWSHQLRFQCIESPSSTNDIEHTARFTIEPRVPVSLTFTPSMDIGGFKLVMKNEDILDESTHHLSFDMLNKTLLDELAKAVLGKANRFSELTGSVIDEEYKDKLKAQLALKRQKEIHDEQLRLRAIEMAEREKATNPKHTLLHKFLKK